MSLSADNWSNMQFLLTLYETFEIWNKNSANVFEAGI